MKKISMVLIMIFFIHSLYSQTFTFEDALGNDNDDFVASNGMYAGLDWTQNGDLSDKSRWEIDTDNNPFSSLYSGSKWVQGFAEGITTPSGGPGYPNRAKFSWDGENPFEFKIIWLRTRFVSDAPNTIDYNRDGVDDRWLTYIEICFRDINNYESTTSVNLCALQEWTEVTYEDAIGQADMNNLKAIFFYGDSGTRIPGVRNDRFAIDNLEIIFPNSPPGNMPDGPFTRGTANPVWYHRTVCPFIHGWIVPNEKKG